LDAPEPDGPRSDEGFALTPWGFHVVSAKYEHEMAGDEGRQEASLRALVDGLYLIVSTHPSYALAHAFSAIPGRQHKLSEALGRALAQKAGKPFRELRWNKPKIGGERDSSTLTCVDRGLDGEVVILVDDVYRSGASFSAGVQALKGRSVLGLVATCTVSSDIGACHSEGVGTV
jgi:hypothetical protein